MQKYVIKKQIIFGGRIMKNKSYPLYQTETINNLRELVDISAGKYGNGQALTFVRKKERISISYKRLQMEIKALGTMLLEGCNNIDTDNHNAKYKDICSNVNMDIQNKYIIALIGENSYEWILTYFAIVNGGNIVLPLDKELPAPDIVNLLKHSGAEVFIYSDDYSDVAEYVRENAESIRDYVNLNQVSGLAEQGTQAIESGNTVFEDCVIDDNEVAALLYTSGTTGSAKGVMLSHKNLACDAVAACQHVGIFGSNMLVLPLHHSFGLVAAVCSMLLKGSEIFINSSLKNVLADLQKYQPSNMFLVPLFVETFYKKVWETAAKQGKDKLLKTMISVSNVFLKIGIDARRVLFKSVIHSFGGNLKLIVSGGAPLDPKYIEGFRELGITILNGYGITECAPIVAVNRNEYNRDGSVGAVLPCCEVRIAEPDDEGNGEIYVRGENVMLGYYKNEDATREAFDNGWFNTGDIGYLDKDGFLFISGRKKNLIILGNGKNVYPEEIENELLRFEYISETVVYAEDGAIVAEVYFDPESAADCAERLDGDILRLNKMLPIYKNIGKIRVRDTEFPKTTTKKIKREYKAQNNV